MTLHHASQPFALFRDGLVPTLPELVFDLPQLRPHSLRDRDPPQPEPSMLGLPTEMREPKEIERLRLPETTSRSAPGGMPSELDQPGLVRVQLQPKLRKPLREKSAQNRRASCSCSKPTVKSSANRTTITSPCANRFLHHWTHRSKT